MILGGHNSSPSHSTNYKYPNKYQQCRISVYIYAQEYTVTGIKELHDNITVTIYRYNCAVLFIQQLINLPQEAGPANVVYVQLCYKCPFKCLFVSKWELSSDLASLMSYCIVPCTTPGKE